MKTQVSKQNIPSVATDLLAVFAVDGAPVKTPKLPTQKEPEAIPQILLLSSDAAVQRAAEAVLASGEFKASANETLLLHSPLGLAAKRLLIVGLGKSAKATIHDLRRAGGTAVRFAKPRGIKNVAFVVPTAVEGWMALPPGPCVQAVVEGALLGDFDSDTYRSDRKDQSVQSVTLLATESDLTIAEQALRDGAIIADAQNFARSLVLEPGNVVTPAVLGERAKAMAEEVGLRCEVYGADKLHELKMGAFWAVAQGSEQPPALIVLTYTPDMSVKDGPVLGLVGKGITFDTGGISIKPADGMEKMKYDMGGGAAMLGAMRAIAGLKPAVRVICVVCAAENMPSGKAYRPGDIVTAKSGKTIEVMNTDAEGRMVLADGLNYARELGATHLIDAATLTGAVGVALGAVNAGAFSNDDATYEHFTRGLAVSGERFWRLPLDDDYREQIKSSIADIMNTGGSRLGGAITAAKFLQEFAEETPWIHLDIAAVTWIDDAKPWLAKGPTGTSVRSIVEWVRTYSAS
ncbi:MAG TPA: leucyl aminopeptidase [Acidisarcina sp.]